MSIGVSAIAVGLAVGGCTSSSDDAARPTTTTETSITVQADPTSTACSQFETMWIEQAQLRSDRLGSPEPDPHGVAAHEAAAQAFDAAAEGSQGARRLGAEAETLYDSQR